jgi:TorA maturation chaperone TorD
MKQKASKDNARMAALAGARARLYAVLVGIFNRLPDDAFLSDIQGARLQGLLETCRDMNPGGFKPAVARIRAYLKSVQKTPPTKILKELSVDRTVVLRGTGHKDLKPPHEGLYTSQKNPGNAILAIKSAYRQAGLMPDEAVCESPDYLCVELDFMRCLCRREEKQWQNKQETGPCRLAQVSFLKEHLGRWVPDFCRQTRKHARTDFYKGFAMLMENFIKMDMAYLEDLKITSI